MIDACFHVIKVDLALYSAIFKVLSFVEGQILS